MEIIRAVEHSLPPKKMKQGKPKSTELYAYSKDPVGLTLTDFRKHALIVDCTQK